MKLIWNCRLIQVTWNVWLHMESVTLLLLLICPKLLSTPPFYVLFKSTLKKLQKEASIEAHLLMLVPLLLVIFWGMMDDEIMGWSWALDWDWACWAWASILKSLIGRTSNALVLDHSSYKWNLHLLVEMTLQSWHPWSSFYGFGSY